MAKAIISFCEVGGRNPIGGSVDAIRLKTVKSKVVATSEDSQVVPTSAEYRYNYVSVTAYGSPIWVASGATPVANPKGTIVLDGQTKDFSIDKGDLVAVANASLNNDDLNSVEQPLNRGSLI